MKKNKDKFNFCILFLVNRGDCEIFKPCWKADPIYAKSLLSAQQCGINLLAIKINWTLKGCYFDKELKIDLEKVVIFKNKTRSSILSAWHFRN